MSCGSVELRGWSRQGDGQGDGGSDRDPRAPSGFHMETIKKA